MMRFIDVCIWMGKNISDLLEKRNACFEDFWKLFTHNCWIRSLVLVLILDFGLVRILADLMYSSNLERFETIKNNLPWIEDLLCKWYEFKSFNLWILFAIFIKTYDFMLISHSYTKLFYLSPYTSFWNDGPVLFRQNSYQCKSRTLWQFWTIPSSLFLKATSQIKKGFKPS